MQTTLYCEQHAPDERPERETSSQDGFAGLRIGMKPVMGEVNHLKCA